MRVPDSTRLPVLFVSHGAPMVAVEAETGRGPEFLRLGNALSILYPKDSDEKRLLDAMLLAVPR